MMNNIRLISFYLDYRKKLHPLNQVPHPFMVKNQVVRENLK